MAFTVTPSFLAFSITNGLLSKSVWRSFWRNELNRTDSFFASYPVKPHVPRRPACAFLLETGHHAGACGHPCICLWSHLWADPSGVIWQARGGFSGLADTGNRAGGYPYPARILCLGAVQYSGPL